MFIYNRTIVEQCSGTTLGGVSTSPGFNTENEECKVENGLGREFPFPRESHGAMSTSQSYVCVPAQRINYIVSVVSVESVMSVIL